MKLKEITSNRASVIDYLVYVVSVLFVLRSRPFLRLPYDMWHHLMLIRGWFHEGTPNLTRPGVQYHEVIWHKIWAFIFQSLNISDVFLWAKIIHCTQFFWTLFCLTYFLDTLLKLVSPEQNRNVWRVCSLLGAWCFVFGAGTFSMEYQLSWMLWYGVNYQGLTLPAYFLAAGMLIKLLLSTDRPANWDKLLLPTIFAGLVIIHPLESLYFLLFLGFFIVVFFDYVFKRMKVSPSIVITIIAPVLLAPLLLYYAHHLGITLPKPPGIGALYDLNALWARIITLGTRIQLNEMHRGLTSFNEMAIIGCIGLFALAAYDFLKTRHQGGLKRVDTRLVFFTALIALFFAIAPRQTHMSGALAVLTVDEQVWRFAFASPWFAGFAIWASRILGRSGHIKRVIWAMAPICLVFMFSRFVGGSFNTTAASLFRSLELIDRHRVGIQYDRTALGRLESIVLSTPSAPPPKINIFLIRADLQTYIRAATGVYVLGDRLGPLSADLFQSLPDKDQYHLVVIKPPDDLPVDQALARTFTAMRLNENLNQ